MIGSVTDSKLGGSCVYEYTYIELQRKLCEGHQFRVYHTLYPRYITVIMTKSQVFVRFESARESMSEGTRKLGKASLIKLNMETVDVDAWLVRVSAF